MNYRVDYDLSILASCWRTHFFETILLFLWSFSPTSALQIFSLTHLLSGFHSGDVYVWFIQGLGFSLLHFLKRYRKFILVQYLTFPQMLDITEKKKTLPLWQNF